MPRAFVHFNDYVSLAVMLLMLVALLGGRTGASELTAAAAPTGPAPVAVTAPVRFEIDGHIGDDALKVSLAVVGELSQFRGEDE